MHRFRFAVRAFTAFVTTALLLANLATTTNSYADLPNCSQHAAHIAHTDTTDHANAGTHTANADDTCCGTCDRCKGYFGAHLQGLNLATTDAAAPAPHVDISTLPVHATDFTSRPNLPPPRSTSVFRLTATA